jgi:uncharacterized tellurite resistance protein B-like protein
MSRNETSFKWLGWELYELPPEVAGTVTDADNMAYAKALIVCAKGDGVISPKEREWLIGYMTTTGVSPSVVEMVKTYDGEDSLAELMKASPGMQTFRRGMLYDALRICASDGELHPAELDRIRHMADLVGISRETLAELEQILVEEEKLRKRRHKLIVADALAEQA